MISMIPGHRHLRSFFEQVCHEPSTIAILSAVSAGVQVVGAISNGMAASADAKSQAKAQEANASILRENAAQASREANAKEDQLRARQRIIRGEQIAGIAQSGIGFEGTGGDLIQESDINATLDDLSVRYEGESARRNLITQADFTAFDAANSRQQARTSKTAGYISAAGSAASAAASYSQYQKLYGSGNTVNSTGYLYGPQQMLN